jgi:hypothetical protein
VAIKPNLLYWFWVAPGFLAGILEKEPNTSMITNKEEDYIYREVS